MEARKIDQCITLQYARSHIEGCVQGGLPLDFRQLSDENLSLYKSAYKELITKAIELYKKNGDRSAMDNLTEFGIENHTSILPLSDAQK